MPLWVVSWVAVLCCAPLAHADSLFESEPRLRACCGLGRNLRTRVGPLAVPVRLHNVIGVDALQTHDYLGRTVFREKNGLLYTCRGGLIDTGHVRTAADWTAHFDAVAQRALGTSRRLDIELDGSRVVLQFHPVDVPEEERRERALDIAAKAAYDVARWHELSTWYGGTTVDIYSELFSALSPEDLYSDYLGVMIARRALQESADYESTMAVLLRESLRNLQVVEPTSTQNVLDALGGRWWEPTVSLPKKSLLKKRSVDTDPPLNPWRVPADWGGCPASAPEATLDIELPSLEPFATLTFVPEADTALSARLGSAVAATDLSARIATVGEEVRQELGPDGTRWSVPDAAMEPDEVDAVLEQSSWPEAEGIRLVPLEIVGGLAGQGDVSDYRASLGGRLIGGLAQTAGGDLSIAQMTAFAGHTDRGFVTHMVGVRSRSVYFCKNRDGETWHAPIFAWFQDCDGRGWLGIGGTLVQWQSDSQTDRRVMRPVELNLVVNALANSLSPRFLRHSLELFGGASVDTRSAVGNLGTELSWRGQGGMRLRLRSSNFRWELQGFGSVRQDFAEGRDRAWEVGGRATHRLLLRDTLQGTSQGPLRAVLTFTIEGGFSYWGVPANSVADWLFPVVSASEKRTTQLLLSVGFTYEGFTI